MSATSFSIKPVWEEVEAVRNKISEFLGENNIPPDEIYSAAMVTSELVENAIKYGEESDKPNIEIFAEYKKGEITVEVRNHIKNADDENLHKLDRAIQWINGFQFPFEAYVEKLKYVSSKDLDEGESGLGLVRIAYEGHANIDFYIDENNTVCISAVLPV